MKPATLKALNASIAHWERLAKNGPSEKEHADSISCALCRRFNPFHAKHPCQKALGERCPVFKRTGEPNCGETPFDTAAELTDFKGLLVPGVTLAEWRAAARRELAFLRSLLPKP